MEDLSVRQILFPTDYSDISANAGRTAAQLARHFSARLHVLNVIPPVTDPGPPDALTTAAAELGAGLGHPHGDHEGTAGACDHRSVRIKP